MSKDLIKRLSHSSEQSVRDQAVDELHSVIKNDKLDYSDLGLKMIFEGIFFCYYHSDKPRYQDALSTKITEFMGCIETEDKKELWSQYFFKCMCMHWNRIDGWRINKYLALIRKHLVVFLKHINAIWDSNAAAVTNYINSIFEEILRGKEVPLGVGMQIADVYLEEIIKNFDKSQLSHERITQLLSPFLKALGKCEQFVLFKRIMDSVFVKLVESNGADSDKSGDLYLPNFKIVDYAEDDIFPIASSIETIATRRDDIYKIYEKASGNERPAAPYVPYEERIKQIKLNSQKLPQTKHQKKKLMRQKIKQVQKIKKRLLKLIRKQQQIPVSDAHHDKIEGHIIGHHTEETQKMEEITKIAIDKINSNAEKNVDTNLASADGTGGTGDKIIEISNTQGKKKKNKNKKAILKESLDNSKKKVSFELKNNKTKEFYMHGQVGESKIPKSKDLKSKRPSIIKRKHRKS